MGQYLTTGIVKTIHVLAKGRYNKIELDQVKSELARSVNLDKYEYSVDSDNTHIFEIKDEHLVGLPEFLRAQFAVYDTDSRGSVVKTLESIKGLSGTQLKTLLSARYQDENLQIVKHVHSYVKFSVGGWEDHVDAFYTLIVFFLDGKILMECYNNILHYFSHMIQSQKDKYPIADCVKVMISG